jgi:hypothetical protein
VAGIGHFIPDIKNKGMASIVASVYLYKMIGTWEGGIVFIFVEGKSITSRIFERTGRVLNGNMHLLCVASATSCKTNQRTAKPTRNVIQSSEKKRKPGPDEKGKN